MYFNGRLNYWTPIADYPGRGNLEPVGFSINGKGYIGTGVFASGIGLQDAFYRYDPANNIWVTIAPFEGGPTRYCRSFTIGQKAYVLMHLAITNNFWEYDPSIGELANDGLPKGIWTQKADLPMGGHMSFSIGEKGYVAGDSDPMNESRRTFWEYDPLTDSWTQMASVPIGSHVAFVVDGIAYVGLGFTNTFYKFVL